MVALKRLKVYLKLIAIGAVVFVLLLVVLMNREYKADVWLFKYYQDVPVLGLILVTALSSVVSWWGISKIFRVLRELKEVRQVQRAEQLRREQQRLADELAHRERQIDEKIRRSIREES